LTPNGRDPELTAHLPEDAVAHLVDRPERVAHRWRRYPSVRTTTRRRADGEDAGRELAGDDRARADDRVRTDRDPGADDDAAAEPDVVADLDRLCRFPLRSALLGLERVWSA
jgi:hypothetical protein